MKPISKEQLDELMGVNSVAPVLPLVEKDPNFERKHPLAECEKCPLYHERHAPTCGSRESKIAFISRSPGKYDVAAGKPFANPRGAGAVLDHLLGRYGIKRDDVLTTNVVLCRSDDPPKEAIAACKPRLEDEIKNCSLVIAGGTESTIALTRYRAVFTARPFIHRRVSASGIKQRVIVTNNPALVVRNSDAYPDMVEDFRRAFDPPPPPVFPEVEIINEPSKARDILRRWNESAPEIIASDLEWRSNTNEPVCAGFAARGERAVVFGLRAISDGGVRTALREFYESDRRFIWHNGKADTKVLALAGLIDPDHDPLGEDTYLQSYCHVPGTKVLLTNLRWKNIEDLIPFEDRIIAFDENQISLMKPADVYEKSVHIDECYEVVTERGSIVVSAGHLWPIGRSGNKRRVWVTTEDLADRLNKNKTTKYTLTYLAPPWEEDKSYEAGYIAGILDGEGHLVKQGGRALSYMNMYRMGFSQNEGKVLSKTLQFLSERDFGFKVYGSSRHDSVMRVHFTGGIGGLLRILGTFRPNRFISENMNYLWEGRRELESVKIISIKPVGKKTVVGISTSSNTLIADGFFSHNCLDERPGYHSLEYLLSTRFGWPDYEPASVKHFKKTGEFDGKTAQEQELNERQLYKYNGWDAAGTFQLYNTLNPRLDSDRGGSVRPLYKRLLHASRRFRDVELNGFHYDVEESCNINEREAIPRLFELTDHIRDVTKKELLNPNSPKQLEAVLYGEWELHHNLRDSGKKKLTQSTGKEVREEIQAGRFTSKPRHREQIVRWAEFQQQYSKISKLKGTYLEGLAIRTLKDGKLYCNFNPCGTVSGRTSSNDPNFQNIAREGYQEIPGIRTLFLPTPGNVIISADFSQAELRTCAKLSGDDNLISIYRDSSRSLHRERAAHFYGGNYTKEEYVRSKNINFGVTYGQSAAAFAQMYHMPQKEAQAYIDDWWQEFPQLLEWTNELKRRARKDGYVLSPFGHKRRFHLITDENIGDVEREAVNFLPQNIAAWLTISALSDLVDAGVRVVATVHDSIVADIPANEVDRTAKYMKEVMESQVEKQLGWTDIPFLVDISVGKNWGDMEELDLTEKVAA